jgi:hypothetical protein
MINDNVTIAAPRTWPSRTGTVEDAVGQNRGGEDQGRGGIKVVDRRHFTSQGDRRLEVPDEPEGGPATNAGPAPRAAQTTPSGFEHRPVDDPPGVDFTMLINAMAQPALVFLGEIPHPASSEPAVDLPQARLQIDMLDLVRVKSRGNLTPQEEELLDRVLYQLRMLYVSRSSQLR